MLKPGFSQPLVFTPGPSMMADRIAKIGSQPLPYHRTEGFAEMTLALLTGLKAIFQTTGEAVIFTASGTAAMEAVVQNFLDFDHRCLIINGGTFGQRWGDLCRSYQVPFDEIVVPAGEDLPIEKLKDTLASQKYSTLFLTAHETATGQLFPTKKIGKLSREHGLLFVVDAISTICCDEFLMDEWQVDVAILSSQKGLALPPGLSFLALNERAKQRLQKIKSPGIYFQIENYLENQQRGQMPYTPAIGLFLMLSERFKQIQELGFSKVIQSHHERAAFFRGLIKELPFELLPQTPSNALTALKTPPNIDAHELVCTLSTNYNIFVAPNAGDLRHRVFRVSHMGEQTEKQIRFLQTALKESLKNFKKETL